MFHNISNPKWFGNWSRLEDDYLGNGGTDIADNFTFSKMEKTGGLFGSIIRLATAFPACDPETGHATGAWKVACESIDLDEVPLSDIADMISGFDCETITDFRLFNTGAFDNTPWQQALGELLLRLRIEKDDYQWIQCPNSESAVNMMNMVMDAHMPKDFFDGFVCGDEEYGLNEEAHEMASGRKEIDTQTETKDVAEWCRDFLRITDELSPELAIADRAERNYLMALVGFLVEWCPRKDLSLESLTALLSLADARENDEDFKSGLDLLFVQIEEGKAYSYVAEYDQYLWVPSKYRRNSDGMKPADRKGLVGSEDFALLCWDSVNHLPAIRRISLKASLTSRLIDFKYLREAEAPAYTHGVSNDIFDYEFDDDDDDIPAFSVPEA